MRKLLTPLKLILIGDGLESNMKNVSFQELENEVADAEEIIKRELTSVEVEDLIRYLEKKEGEGTCGN